MSQFNPALGGRIPLAGEGGLVRVRLMDGGDWTGVPTARWQVDRSRDARRGVERLQDNIVPTRITYQTAHYKSICSTRPPGSHQLTITNPEHTH